MGAGEALTDVVSMHTVSLGPFAWTLTMALLLAGAIAALTIDSWLRRRGHASCERALWSLLLLALVVARAAFVVTWWSNYAVEPWSVLDLRDGGFSLPAGLVALILGAAIWVWRRPLLRTPLLGSLLGGALVGGFGLLVAARLDAATHAPLPAVVLRDLDDRPVPLHSLAGKPLVVNLWATWCPPCRREMPVLVRAQQEHGDVRFVFVDQGESAADVRAFLHSTGLRPDHMLLDPMQQLPQAFGTQAFPTTLWFDARGELRSVHVGALSPASLAAELSHILPDAAVAPAASGVSR
jgi:thiol-disulfide isomerase/thioredoxin